MVEFHTVFTILRPISVEVSRYQLLGSCDPIIGSATGAVDSQRDALTHRAILTRDHSSIENDVDIEMAH